MSAGIPLPALGLRPPESPVEQMGKVIQLKSMLQNQKLQQQTMQENALGIQQKEQDQKDQQTVMQVLGAHNGDMGTALPELAGKITAKTYLGLVKSHEEIVKSHEEMTEKKLTNQKMTNDQLSGLVDQAGALPPEQYAAAWPQIAAKALEIDPRLKDHVNPQQPIPQQALPQLKIGFQTQAQYAAQEAEKRAVAEEARKAAEAAPKLKKDTAEAETADVKVQAENEWLAANPGKNHQDYAEHMMKLVPQTRIAVGAGDKANTRSDKSYQFNVGELNKLGTPVSTRLQRLSTLQDTINQTTPQADALIAPELLTVMAGGQGSGLRMNEAEIARIVGGRTNFESLKAALNKWQIDPSKGLSVTPSQREQIRSLVKTVNDKLQSKQDMLDQAQQDLINADSPEEHRRIVADTRKKLSTVDESPSSSGQFVVSDPNGGKHTFKDQASADAFKKAAGIQ